MRGYRRIKAVVLALVGALLAAQPLAAIASPGLPARVVRTEAPLITQPVFTDFDQDSRPDRAELFSHGSDKEIQITLGNSWVTHLHFECVATDQGRLLAGDVDHDNDADLIWVSYTDPRGLAVWLGDGRGRFVTALQPQLFAGAVTSLLRERDGGLSPAAPDAPENGALAPSTQLTFTLHRRFDFSLPPAVAFEGERRTAAQAALIGPPRKRGPPVSFS